MERISKMSCELYAYCRYYHTSFPDCFDGEEEDICRVVDETIGQYSESIKMNLGASFDDIKGELITRDYLEKDLIPKVIKNADRSFWVIRKNQVISFAKKGKLQPLSDFLQAYCTPEESIWWQILEVCLPFGVAEETRAYIYEMWRFYQNEKGPLEGRVWRFQEALKSKNHFPIIEQPSNASVSKKRPLAEIGGKDDSQKEQASKKLHKTSSEK